MQRAFFLQQTQYTKESQSRKLTIIDQTTCLGVWWNTEAVDKKQFMLRNQCYMNHTDNDILFQPLYDGHLQQDDYDFTWKVQQITR